MRLWQSYSWSFPRYSEIIQSRLDRCISSSASSRPLAICKSLHLVVRAALRSHEVAFDMEDGTGPTYLPTYNASHSRRPASCPAISQLLSPPSCPPSGIRRLSSRPKATDGSSDGGPLPGWLFAKFSAPPPQSPSWEHGEVGKGLDSCLAGRAALSGRAAGYR